MWSIRRFGWVLRVNVQILQQNRLRKCWLIVYAWAAVSMPAGSNLKIKRAVDSASNCKMRLLFVFLSSKTGKVPEKRSGGACGVQCLVLFRLQLTCPFPYQKLMPSTRPLRCCCNQLLCSTISFYSCRFQLWLLHAVSQYFDKIVIEIFPAHAKSSVCLILRQRCQVKIIMIVFSAANLDKNKTKISNSFLNWIKLNKALPSNCIF